MSLAPDIASRPLTHRDLDYTPEDGNRYEVIDGELYVTPFPGYAHQNFVSELVQILGQFVRENRPGKVFAPGLKVVLDEPTGVGPDLTYISEAQMVHMREDGFYGAPDLIVEALSTKPQLDRYVKFRKYASAGVPHYWIGDPKARILETFRLESRQYRRTTELQGETQFKPELFPGLTIELAELWV